jgi:hypothetical protein
LVHSSPAALAMYPKPPLGMIFSAAASSSRRLMISIFLISVGAL